MRMANRRSGDSSVVIAPAFDGPESAATRAPRSWARKVPEDGPVPSEHAIKSVAAATRYAARCVVRASITSFQRQGPE